MIQWESPSDADLIVFLVLKNDPKVCLGILTVRVTVHRMLKRIVWEVRKTS